MNDQEAKDPDPADETNDQAAPDSKAEKRTDLTPSEAARSIVARPSDEEPSARLPLVLPPAFWDGTNPAPGASRAGPLRRRAMALAAVMICLIVVGAAAFVVVDHSRQAGLLAERTQENAKLAETVSSLDIRLQTIESAKGRDELAELRRSVGDLKTAAVSSRELSAAIAQLSQRVEKLDREQGAKLDKLGERVDHESNAAAAEIAARLDKLEKSPAQPAPPAGPAAQPPKFGANVSMEPTASIDRSRQVLRGYVVLGAGNDIAVIGGRYGERAVRAGDYLPGAGRIERVERQGANWVVVTDQGLIAPAYAAPF
jgi:arsenate reductase-like glutaredoxin family protein